MLAASTLAAEDVPLLQIGQRHPVSFIFLEFSVGRSRRLVGRFREGLEGPLPFRMTSDVDRSSAQASCLAADALLLGMRT